MTKKAKKPEFVDLHEDTINEINEFIKSLSLATDLQFVIVGCPRQKETVIIKKVPKLYEFKFGYHVAVMINEELYEQVSLDKTAIEILLNDAFNGLNVDPNTGSAKIKDEKITASKDVIESYGIDPVKAAKDLEASVYQQIKDKEDENDDIDVDISI